AGSFGFFERVFTIAADGLRIDQDAVSATARPGQLHSCAGSIAVAKDRVMLNIRLDVHYSGPGPMRRATVRISPQRVHLIGYIVMSVGGTSECCLRSLASRCIKP